MCGIAGVFGHRDRLTVAAMLDALRHRGPDDSHVVGDSSFTLGARRLSIVDAAGGRQPVSCEREAIWAAQNGELYNFVDQRACLQSRGHRLNSRCDTEIIPHLYEEYGVDLPLQLDGMFAVCVWDNSQKRGLLIRDRIGQKPLYYLEIDNALYFASEIKALLLVPGFERRLNFQSLHHYLALKHIPEPLTAFEGIKALPPAHRLIWERGKTKEISRYWSPCFTEVDCLSEDEATDGLTRLLTRAVCRRNMGDAPVGYFLSGGIDSSLIAAVAAEASGSAIKTFTLTYENDSTTEGKEQDSTWARWVADRYRTEHHEERVGRKSLPQLLRKSMACFDQPFAGVITTYLLAQRISKHVKVALAGDGADELFGSYLTHRLASPLANYKLYQQTNDASLISPFEREPRRLERLVAEEDWIWRSRIAVFSEGERAQLYSEVLAKSLGGWSTFEYWKAVFGDVISSSPLNRILEAEMRSVFPDQVLSFVDRLSMAHSLEVRCPFLDLDVVNFANQLPSRYKIKGGETKHILKCASLRYFPSEMVHRPKEGFLLPLTSWLQLEMEEYIRDTLSSVQLGRHDLFDCRGVQELIDQMYGESADYTHVNKVYSLLAFQEWYDLYMS